MLGLLMTLEEGLLFIIPKKEQRKQKGKNGIWPKKNLKIQNQKP